MRVADARQEADAKESALQALLDQPEAARTGEPKAAEA
jgi:hypothetical protein